MARNNNNNHHHQRHDIIQRQITQKLYVPTSFLTQLTYVTALPC